MKLALVYPAFGARSKMILPRTVTTRQQRPSGRCWRVVTFVALAILLPVLLIFELILIATV